MTEFDRNRRPRRSIAQRSGVLSCAMVICMAACGDRGTTDLLNIPDSVITPPTAQWYRPTVTTTWQWQLLGTTNTAYDVDLYDIDLFDSSETLIASLQTAGRRVICYFSAGSFEDFRPDAASFPSQVLGNPLDDFPDERWLDIRSPSVLTIMEARLDMAVDKGCDGVEPDNMDGFANNSGFSLTSADQLTFNRNIATEAHERGLSVGLKNDLDQISDLISFSTFRSTSSATSSPSAPSSTRSSRPGSRCSTLNMSFRW